MDRDLRDTQTWKDVESFYRAVLDPGSGRDLAFGVPEPSPDGRWVAVRGEVLETLEGHPLGRLTLVGADGSGARRLTNGPNDDAEPRWSPDGSRLTFRSDRRAKSRHQLYMLDAGAIGEARPLPEVPGTVEHHRWSPDGSRILVVVAAAKAEQADALGSGTLGADEDVPSWLPEVESFEDAEEWRTLWVLDVAAERARRVSPEGLNIWEATWCGDRTAVAIASSGPTEGAWYTAPLVAIDLETGEAWTVFESTVQLGYAEGAPDGSVIAVIEAVCSDRYLVTGDLLLVDPGSGEARRVETGGVDVSWVRWSGDRLFAMGLAGMDGVALDVDVDAAVAKERWRTAESLGLWAPAGSPLEPGGFVTIRSSSDRPPEVVTVYGKESTLLSTDRDGLDEIRRHVAGRERVQWSAPDGWEIEGLLTTPAAASPPHPMILFVHGGPISSYTDSWPGALFGLLLARGYAVLQPNPRGSAGRGKDFASAVVGDMGGADSADLLAGVDAMVERGVADAARIGVMGGSYGGYMAAWLPAIDDRFAAAVSLSPVTDWYSAHFNSSLTAWVGGFMGASPEEPGGVYHDRSPVLRGAALRTPTLLTSGYRDRATPVGQAVEHYRALRQQGVEAEVALYPEEGHGVGTFPAIIDLAVRTVTWFERYMPARAGE